MANYEWSRARNEMVNALRKLGFPAELGDELAKNLGSPKAMERMTSYYVQSHKPLRR